MPGVSQKFPPEKRNSIFPKLDANEPLKGFTHNPDTGDLTVATVFHSVAHLSTFIWDALGFLDISDQQQTDAQQRAAAQDVQIAALRQDVAELKALLGPVVQIVRSLGTEVPDWLTRDDVENGRPDMVDVLSAKQAGLLVTFEVVQDLGFDPRVIIRIEPPVGTFVARGSEVVVTVNDG